MVIISLNKHDHAVLSGNNSMCTRGSKTHVNFLKTAFTAQTDLTVVPHSAANIGLPSNNYELHDSMEKVNHIGKSKI
jgi:hypothetical protein